MSLNSSRSSTEAFSTVNCTTSFTFPLLATFKFATPSNFLNPTNCTSNCSERLPLPQGPVGGPGKSPLAGRIKSKTYAVRSPLNYASTVAAKTRIQRCLCREVDEIWQYCVGGNLTTFDKDHGAVEEGRSRIEAFATIAIYSWWQSSELKVHRICSWPKGEGWSWSWNWLGSGSWGR